MLYEPHQMHLTRMTYENNIKTLKYGHGPMSTFTISVPQGFCPLDNALRRGALDVLGRFKPLQSHPPPCASKYLLKLRHLTVVTSRRGLRGILRECGGVRVRVASPYSRFGGALGVAL